MKKWCKWLAVGMLSLSLLSGGSSFADSNGQTVKELSLQQSIDLALKQNPKVEIADIGVQKAQVAYDGAKYKADKLDSDYVQTYEAGLLKWYAPRAAQMGLTIAKAKNDLSQKGLKLEVENDYYDVLKKQKLLQIAKDAYQRAQDQLKIAQASVKAGTMAKGDLLGVQALVASNDAQVTAAQNNYDMALLTFNKALGMDLNTQIKLTSQFVYEKAQDIDYQKSLKDALDNDISILAVKENLAVTEEKAKVAEKFYGGGVTDYETAKLEAKEADLKVKQQEQEITLSVRQSYLNLIALEKMIAAYNKNVDMQKENLRIMTLKYKAGLATNLDMTGASLDLQKAEEQATDALFKYNLAKAAFKYGVFSTSGDSSAGADSSDGSAAAAGM